MTQKGRKPEVRFTGFTEDWEQRKLGELGSVAMNRRIFKEQTSENGRYRFIKLGHSAESLMPIFQESFLKNINPNIPIRNLAIFSFPLPEVLEELLNIVVKMNIFKIQISFGSVMTKE